MLNDFTRASSCERKSSQLWMAIRFPDLAMEALDVFEDSDVQACLIASPRKKVCAASDVCIEEGVHLGMPVSTAQLLLDCRVFPRDRDKERQSLCEISNALYNYTPYLQCYTPNPQSDTAQQGIFLELSRCLKLFKGLDAIKQGIFECLQSLGFKYQYGIGFRAKAAWLLSYAKGGNEQREGAGLESLPVDLLEEFPDKVEALKKTGFNTLGDIQRQIKAGGIHALQKRFGQAFIQYLSEILGHISGVDQEDLFTASIFSQALPVYKPEEKYSDQLQFDYPISSIEQLHKPFESMLESLVEYLVDNQLQCFGVQWIFSDIYHNKEALNVRCEKVFREGERLLELSMIQLEQGGLPFEVDSIELRCTKLTEVSFQRNHLHFDKRTAAIAANGELELTTARINARMGEDKVFKIRYVDDHIPELANEKVAVNDDVSQSAKSQHLYADRPAWIFNTPVAIGSEQNNLRWQGKLQLLRGPERIEGHWWDKPSARDYFVAVRDDHIRVWVFNDLLKQSWYIQGVF